MEKYYKKKGCLTICEEVEVDIDIDDIIDNLNKFNKDELEELKESIDEELGCEQSDNLFDVNNLEDEFKIKILKEMFYKYSWEELDKIKKIHENNNQHR